MTSIDPKWLVEYAPSFFKMGDSTKLSTFKKNQKIDPLFDKYGCCCCCCECFLGTGLGVCGVSKKKVFDLASNDLEMKLVGYFGVVLFKF